MKTISAIARTRNNPTIMPMIPPVLRVLPLLMIAEGDEEGEAVTVVEESVENVGSGGALRPEPVPVWPTSTLRVVPAVFTGMVMMPDGVTSLGRGIFEKECG